MERLGDALGGRLRIACAPCGRAGSYVVARLIIEYGAECTLEALKAHLAVGCRWKRAPGMRQPGKYEPKCQARLILPGARPMNSGSFETFSSALSVFRIDVWHDEDGSGIAREILLCTDLTLARRWFQDVAEKYPDKFVTLRQRAQVLMSNEKRLPHGTGRW